MPKTLPMPVRVAAGLLASGVDHLKRLPEELPALTVTLAGQAMRLSMRARQQLADLAIRGDEVLGGITDEQPEEHPAWARFDEEEPGGDGIGADSPASDDLADDPAETPRSLRDYPGMSLAQLRGHLRRLSAADLADVIEFEREHYNRAPYLTVLSNRLATLERGRQ